MRAILVLVFFSVCPLFAGFQLTWALPAVSLDSNPPFGDRDLDVKTAMDSEGNAIAVWGRTAGQGAQEDVWASYYSHSSRVWTGAVKISGGENASNPDVVIDANGNVLVVWEEGFPSQIVFRTFFKQQVWSPPISEPAQALASSINTQTTPHLRCDKEGNALALWMEISRGVFQIHSARKRAGENWERLGCLSREEHAAKIPSVAAFSLNCIGEALAVWEEPDLGRIAAAKYEQGGWSLPLDLGEGESPAVGLDKNGRGIITWVDKHTILSRIWTYEGMSDSLEISNPLFLAKHPFLAIDGLGNAVVVYERYDGPPNAVHIAKFIAAACLEKGSLEWSSSVDISGPSLEPSPIPGAGYPVVVLNEIGDGVAVWKEFNGSHVVVNGAGYSLGNWSIFRALSHGDDNSGSRLENYDIAVSLNNAGNILAVWPEDPSQNGSSHVKAVFGVGLAIVNPEPPFTFIEEEVSMEIGVAYGKQILHEFPAHADLINILNWSSYGEVAYYRVYRGSLSQLIATTSKPYFEDHRRIPKKVETYLITCVDAHDQESSPMTIFVKPR